jgi:hypothetical protein
VSDAIENFLDELGKSLSSDTFVKLTVSNYKGANQHLQKISGRVVKTKRGRQLSLQYFYDTRQMVKNYAVDEAAVTVRDLLQSGFRSAHLFTTSGDFQLTIGKKNSRLIAGKPTFTAPPSSTHDRRKTTLVDPRAFYLEALGITTGGQVRSPQQDKWRQINKYVEILGGLFDNSSLHDKPDLRIVDMGSGKGYLTFAAFDYFQNVRHLKVSMTGVEARKELVDLCNQIAESGGLEGLNFEQGNIADFEVGEADMLIALHACDTATDDALFKGIAGKAEVIVAAPCCHKEIRRQIKSPDVLRDILKHGTMLEREAETITDGLRAMLLERSGYATKVFEFVSPEHTPKNNMISATRRSGQNTEAERLELQIDAVKRLYGISEQRLENLLA